MATEPTFGSDVSTTLAGVDDPNNAIGLSAPAIIRHTVYAHLAAGVTMGAGQTNTVRAATGVGLQAAITASINGNYWFELSEGTYEIYNAAGLVAYAPGALVYNHRGTNNSQIRQFYANAPIFTLGGTAGSNFVNVDGMYLGYGVSQAGNTNAIALTFSNLAQFSIRNVAVGGPGLGETGTAYVCIQNTIASFDGLYENIYAQGGQSHIWQIQNDGSGSVWESIFLTGGGLNAPIALSGYAFGFDNGSGNPTISFLDVEAVKVNQLLKLGTCRELTMNGVHLETITLTGANPVVFALGTSRVFINGCELDFRLNTADGASGTGALVGTYGNDVVQMNQMALSMNSTDSASVNLPFAFVSQGGTPDSPPSIVIDNAIVDDFNGSGVGSLAFMDANMPLANFATPTSIQKYSSGWSVSKTDGAIIPIAYNYTHYCANENASILYPVSLAAATTLTLSNKMRATGTLGGRSGITLRVRRAAGTYANTLTIVDAASSTTLATNSAAATDYMFSFNGTNWALVT